MELIKAYARQHHNVITVALATGETQRYNHRTTDMNLFATSGGHVLEINQFADFDSHEPHTHEMVMYPASIRVESVEEIEPNVFRQETAPPADYTLNQDDPWVQEAQADGANEEGDK